MQSMFDRTAKTVFDVPFGSFDALNDKWGTFRGQSKWSEMALSDRVHNVLEFFHQVPPVSTSPERWQLMWGDGLVSQKVCDARSYIFPFRKKMYASWSWVRERELRAGGALSGRAPQTLVFKAEIRFSDGVIDVWALERTTRPALVVTADYVSANSPR